MHHFSYKSGILHAEDVSLARIAAEVGTPFYCYSTATLERHYQVLAHAFRDQKALICFAVKANSNQAVLATMARLGAGMDVVSEGELRRARAAGVAVTRLTALAPPGSPAVTAQPTPARTMKDNRAMRANSIYSAASSASANSRSKP